MHNRAQRPRLRFKRRSNRAQALVEMALVLPLLLGIVAILLQFGVLFISYLSLVHATRDIARFVAVHPDTADGAPAWPTPPCSVAGPPATEPTPVTLWDHVCRYDVPSVIDKSKLEDL